MPYAHVLLNFQTMHELDGGWKLHGIRLQPSRRAEEFATLRQLERETDTEGREFSDESF